MEDELKCIYCNDFYCNPVLLPCFHSLCYACALQLQEKFNQQQTLINGSTTTLNNNTRHSNKSNNNNNNEISMISNAIVNAAKSAIALSSSQSPTSQNSLSPSSSVNMDCTLSINDFGSSIVSDLDKLSVFSETDSGVAMSTSSSSSSSSSNSKSSNSRSRPLSYLSNQQYSPTDSNYSNLSINSHQSSSTNRSVNSKSDISSPPPLPLFNTSPLYSTYLPCPKCNRMIYMDETGVDSLTKNTCLENIVERYTESKKLNIKCQMCPAPAEKDAVVMCEQCEIYYCEPCKDTCHPMRGPLQKHVLVASKLGRDLIKKKNRFKESKCSDHLNENVNLYCLLCKCACCNLCVTDTAHINHQMQQINTFCKSQKVSYFFYIICPAGKGLLLLLLIIMFQLNFN
jgi:tripartite motif-containing protein 9/67